MNFTRETVEKTGPDSIGDVNSTRTYYSSFGGCLSTGNLKYFQFETNDEEYVRITLCISGKLMNKVCITQKRMRWNECS